MVSITMWIIVHGRGYVCFLNRIGCKVPPVNPFVHYVVRVDGARYSVCRSYEVVEGVYLDLITHVD